MKKNILFLLVLIVIFAIVTAIIIGYTQNKTEETGKIEIVSTLFPQYDFAKKVGRR